MKKIIMLIVLLTASLVYASETKTVLECSEKFSSLTIKQKDNVFEITRSIRTNRVKGSAFINGVVSTESYGTLMAKIVKSEADSLVFKTEKGKYMKLAITVVDEYLKIELKSNDNDLLNDFKEILKTSENPLEFYDISACKINQ